MGGLTVFCGPMFGGKTTRLLAEAERYSYQKRNILAYKPIVDDRYDDEYIVSHNGFKLKAKKIYNAEEIFDDVGLSSERRAENSVIIVDESFMIKDSGKVLPDLYKLGHSVLVSTLQISSSGEPFNEVQRLLPYATKIIVCPAVCPLCLNDAYFTKKIAGRKDHNIEVGGAELYQPRCANHFNPSFDF